MTPQTLSIHRLSVATIFKVLLIGTALSIMPFGLLMGILALFGANTVTWNGEQIHGFWGLVAGGLIGAVLAVFLTGFLGVACAIGAWVYSKFKPITMAFYVSAGTPTTHSASSATVKNSEA